MRLFSFRKLFYDLFVLAVFFFVFFLCCFFFRNGKKEEMLERKTSIQCTVVFCSQRTKSDHKLKRFLVGL